MTSRRAEHDTHPTPDHLSVLPPVGHDGPSDDGIAAVLQPLRPGDLLLQLTLDLAAARQHGLDVTALLADEATAHHAFKVKAQAYTSRLLRRIGSLERRVEMLRTALRQRPQ